MKNSVKELTEGMQRLCAVANRIVAHSGEVSRIERDLLLEDLRRLYDVALRMGEEKEEGEKRKVESVPEPDNELLSSTVMATMAAMGVEGGDRKEELVPQPVPQPEPEPKPQPESKPDPDLEPELESVAEPEPQIEPVELPKMEDLEANGNGLLFDEVIIEPEVSKEAEIQSESEQDVPLASDAQEAHTTGVQASLLDYLHHPQSQQTEGSPMLGEQLKPATHTLGEKLGDGKKVSDLRTVININDKFSFMSELFHNNMKAYNDFILRLNAIDTRDEALMCVNEVSAQYKWNEGSPAVQSFYKVFDKKF